MKKMIYQVCVGDTPPPYYKTCIQSVKDYCERHGIHHVIQREPILKIRPLNSKRSKDAVERMGYLPIYEKENAFNYLDEYDQICIVDADIFIRESAPDIFNELDDDTVFAGVLEKDMPLTPEYQKKIQAYSQGQYGKIHKECSSWPQGPFGYAFYNMGLMLFSSKIKDYLNGETPEQFIRRPEFQRFVDGEGSWRWSTDQTLLNYWVRKSGMQLKNLDWRWNALFKAVTDDKILDSYFIHFFLSANLPKKGGEIIDIVRDLDQASEVTYRHH